MVDGAVAVWDPPTGKQLASFSGAPGAPNYVVGPGTVNASFPIVPVDFDRDGSRLLVAGPDRYARLWDLHRETRSPAEIAALVARHSPFRLEDGELVTASRGQQPRN